LYGFPGIDDVAALGMPAANHQQEIWLVIASQTGVDEAGIRTFLAMKNPLWTIARITFSPLIDRNKMGKIVRHAMRKKLLNN
jgi:acyl-coenzyme A synthetase/AMP-(fatty) acid ligase